MTVTTPQNLNVQQRALKILIHDRTNLIHLNALNLFNSFNNIYQNQNQLAIFFNESNKFHLINIQNSNLRLPNSLPKTKYNESPIKKKITHSTTIYTIKCINLVSPISSENSVRNHFMSNLKCKILTHTKTLTISKS